MATHTAREDGRRRRLSPEVRRRQVLDAAVAVFSEQGFHGASMDDVAARAGVSKPSVYAHGGSKEELFGACLRREGDRLVRSVSDGRDGPEGCRRRSGGRDAGPGRSGAPRPWGPGVLRRRNHAAPGLVGALPAGGDGAVRRRGSQPCVARSWPGRRSSWPPGSGARSTRSYRRRTRWSAPPRPRRLVAGARARCAAGRGRLGRDRGRRPGRAPRGAGLARARHAAHPHRR